MAESNTDTKKKISQLLIKLGEGYIQMGATLEQRENYLRTVATAWNLACLDPKLRAKALNESVAKFIEKESWQRTPGNFVRRRHEESNPKETQALSPDKGTGNGREHL